MTILSARTTIEDAHLVEASMSIKPLFAEETQCHWRHPLPLDYLFQTFCISETLSSFFFLTS